MKREERVYSLIKEPCVIFYFTEYPDAMFGILEKDVDLFVEPDAKGPGNYRLKKNVNTIIEDIMKYHIATGPNEVSDIYDEMIDSGEYDLEGISRSICVVKKPHMRMLFRRSGYVYDYVYIVHH